jgi:hypothetical protein
MASDFEDYSENTAFIDVLINPVNDLPEFVISGNLLLEEDFTSTESITVTLSPIPEDELNQAITFSLVPEIVSFANTEINSETGEVTVTSIENMSGTQEIAIVANDGQDQNNIVSHSFVLSVEAINDPPLFTVSGDITAGVNFTQTQFVTVNPAFVPDDEILQVVSYSLEPPTVSFANVNINTATGEVSISSVPDQEGMQTFTITADDDEIINNTASQSFVLFIDPDLNIPFIDISNELTVFPNPTSEKLCFDLNNEMQGNIRINIREANGKLIKTFDLEKNAGHFHFETAISSLSSGLYFVEMVLENKRGVKRIMIK